MNYFETEHFTDIDMINIRGLYFESLKNNLELHRQIDNLEKSLHYYKTVCKSRKIHHVAV
jgi:hypothetical protein